MSQIYRWTDAGRLATRVRADGMTVVLSKAVLRIEPHGEADPVAPPDVGDPWEYRYMSEDSPPEPTPPAKNEPGSIADAYAEMTAGLRERLLGAEQLKYIGEGFRARLPVFDTTPVDILDGPMQRMQERIVRDQEIVAQALADYEPDTTPDEIAANTARAADLMREQNAAIAQLVEVTLTNLALSKDQQEQADRTEKFARRMSWASLAVAGGSLAAAVVAIGVGVITIQS